jgi:YfiH family protein
MVTHRLIEDVGHREARVEVLRESAGWTGSPKWREFDWLWQGFSTRKGGVSLTYRGIPATPGSKHPNRDELPGELNLGFTAADQEDLVRENRLRLVESITGSRNVPLLTVRQVHSNRTVPVPFPGSSLPGSARTAGPLAEADGMITRTPGILLGIQTADCIPVLVVDVANRVVAAFHAGWRGTVQRVVELGVRRMRLEFGSQPGNLQAALGPGIGACCYAVGSEVQAKFGESFEYGAELFRLNEDKAQEGPSFHLDLREANRRQLMDAGVSESAISLVGGCTSCEPELYFSHRASGGNTGRMMAVIGIRPHGD